MYEIELSPQAVDDLKEIKSYIEDELQNPIVAKNTVLKIIEAYENLASSQNSGVPVQKYVSFQTDYRFVLANNYSVFYRVENEKIRVVRILYSRRDFVNILFGEKK